MFKPYIINYINLAYTQMTILFYSFKILTKTKITFMQLLQNYY